MTQSASKLSIISHPDLGLVRSMKVKGEPWFVAKDLCGVLGISNSRDAMYKLDDDERGVSVLPTPSGNQEFNVVNESGMYNLIFQSRKPEAKAFRKWVTSEVLPAIRRQGFYVHPSAQLTSQELKKIQKVMHENVGRYIIAEDYRRCARRFGVQETCIRRVLQGYTINNDIMLDLQERALANQQRWSDAYDVERMKGVITALSK